VGFRIDRSIPSGKILCRKQQTLLQAKTSACRLREPQDSEEESHSAASQENMSVFETEKLTGKVEAKPKARPKAKSKARKPAA
jgi:hypothetical protein